MRVLTVATGDERGWTEFLLSADRFGWDVEPLGWGEKWLGLGQKLKLVYQEIARMHDGEIVFFTDSYDAVFVRPDPHSPSNSRYREMVPIQSLLPPCGVLMSAETNCHPHGELAERYPKSPTRWRFLNSGGWLARAGAMRAILQEMKVWSLPDSMCDQGLLTDYHLAHPGRIVLDHHCRVFQTLWGCESQVEVRGSCVQNRGTGTFPYVLHANGGVRMIAGVGSRASGVGETANV